MRKEKESLMSTIAILETNITNPPSVPSVEKNDMMRELDISPSFLAQLGDRSKNGTGNENITPTKKGAHRSHPPPIPSIDTSPTTFSWIPLAQPEYGEVCLEVADGRRSKAVVGAKALHRSFLALFSPS